MSVLPVYLYDHPVLDKPTKPVEDINDDIRLLIRQMIETMHGADGIGLAANQVGRGLALTVIDLGADDEEYPMEKPLVLINPTIELFSDTTNDMQEGCLSLPGFRDVVTRPDAVKVRFFDENMQEHTIDAEGMLARVMQHEIDHLNGVYFFQRLSPVRKAMAHNKLKRIQRGNVDTSYPVRSNKR